MGFFGGGGSSVDLASPPAIGSTTPNTGAFTSLTVKASTGLTDRSITGSGTNSGLSIEASNAYILTANQYATRFGRGGDLGVTIRSDSAFGITSGNADATTDTILRRDAANTFAQRNATNAQTFRLYNTFTDASNYERGFFRWASNVLEIGTEAAGTGTGRTIDIKIGTTSALSFNASAQANFSSRVTASGGFSTGGAFLFVDPISNGFRFTDGSGSTIASGGLFLYNVYTNITNNERGFVRWGSNRFQVGTISIGTGTARSCEVTFYTSASDPTSADITAGYFSVWKNSGTGTIKLWANDGGTMKSVALA
jgi:hypothetical protein